MEQLISKSTIRIVEVRVRNFRSIKEVNIKLDELTVLIGENNSGKTSFIEAMFAAIGSGRRVIHEDDIYLSVSENKIPKDRKVIIDILIRPIDIQGHVVDAFPSGDYWLSLWGRGISQDEDDNDFVAIRTQMKWDSIRAEFTTERRFLKDWPTDPAKLEDARIKDDIYVSIGHIEPLALYFMDAKRDIQDELQNRNSFWYKLVSDPGLTDDQIEQIEDTLTALNEQIITNSDVLTHVQEHLNDLYQAVACDRNSVIVTPVSRNMRDLNKGIGINFATKGAQTFPLIRHGMGTRSLAALLTFRAYTTWRQRNKNGQDIHPMLALEEPETHLHPQAQRALFRLIEQIPGQRIVSTHSPYIVSQSRLDNLRHFRKDGADTIVNQLDISGLSEDDIRKIERMVINTRGDLLYARAVVLFEGESEEQALPIFAEYSWDRHPNDIGISFIGVGGDGSYLPFLRLASSFKIPWYVFSDGEMATIKRLSAAILQLGIIDYINAPNIFIIPNGNNYEQYLLSEGYDNIISNTLDSIHKINYVSEFISKMQHQKTKGGDTRDYTGVQGRLNAINDILKRAKTKYAAPIARSIVTYSPGSNKVPSIVNKLLNRISVDLDL